MREQYSNVTLFLMLFCENHLPRVARMVGNDGIYTDAVAEVTGYEAKGDDLYHSKIHYWSHDEEKHEDHRLTEVCDVTIRKGYENIVFVQFNPNCRQMTKAKQQVFISMCKSRIHMDVRVLG